VAKRDDDFGVLLAGGILLGLGLLAASGSKETAEARRRRFEASVRDKLQHRNVRLESLTLGRGRENEPFWDLLLDVPAAGLRTVRETLPVGTDPYADSVPARLSDAVEKQLAGYVKYAR
jgi:hypothetical protein